MYSSEQQQTNFRCFEDGHNDGKLLTGVNEALERYKCELNTDAILLDEERQNGDAFS